MCNRCLRIVICWGVLLVLVGCGGAEPIVTSTATPAGAVSGSSANRQFAVYEGRSGQEIGLGVVHLYAPETLAYPDEISVEVELHLTALRPEYMPEAVDLVTLAAPTPLAAARDERLLRYSSPSPMRVYQQAGAALTCSDLVGCDGDGYPRDNLKPLRLENLAAEWSWSVRGTAEMEGQRTLTLVVWHVQPDAEGELLPFELDRHSFTIVVAERQAVSGSGGASGGSTTGSRVQTPASNTEPQIPMSQVMLVLGLAVVVFLGVLVGGVVWSRRG